MSVQANATHSTVVLRDDERTLCDVYSRVMGYLRPTSDWNIGKRGEWADRHHYREEEFGG